MKGVVVDCLASLVNEKYGTDKWREILDGAGVPRFSLFLATQDVEEEKVLDLVTSLTRVLGLTLPQAADAFGDYWVNVYSQKIYSPYYKSCRNAREFLLSVNEIHRKTTAQIKDARPPRFTYEWENDDTLIMHYHSERGLIDFMVGLIKGVGTFYKERLEVEKLSDDKARVRFRGRA